MNPRDAYFVRAIRGPVTLITVGALFALNNFTPYRFEQTWPVLLIVFGLLSLMRRAVPRQVPPATGGPVPPYPSYTWPGSGGTSAGASGGTFRQSHYPGTAPPAPSPEQPVKGGFGASAQRPAEPETNPPSGDRV